MGVFSEELPTTGKLLRSIYLKFKETTSESYLNLSAKYTLGKPEGRGRGYEQYKRMLRELRARTTSNITNNVNYSKTGIVTFKNPSIQDPSLC